MRGDDEPGAAWGLRELSVRDATERDVPDGAVPLPTLVTGLRRDSARLSSRIEIGQRREPRDPGDAVARATAPICILEVIGERARLGLGEAERPKLLEGVQAETSGSDLTMPTPCSRFVATMISARAMIACETSASGSTATMASPSSA